MLKPLARFLGLLIVACAALQAADMPRLSQVRKVYFWPMRNAFDQYIAQQVARAGIFEVVVDPKMADAIMTERIDRTFLDAIEELFPQEEPEDAEEPSKGEDDADEEKKEGASSGEMGTIPGLAVKRPANVPRGRPDGTLFLVDIQSRKVLWSTFVPDFDPLPKKLNKYAAEVAQQLNERLTVGANP